MQWLNVPHIRQTKSGWCLPACVAMVTAYLEQPLLQDDVAIWLNTRAIGTPASNIERLERKGFDVFYGVGSLSVLRNWLDQKLPAIVFVRTGELPYWQEDTPHAIVVAGFEGNAVAIFDPDHELSPVIVSTEDLMLAWSHYDYAYAVLQIAE